MGKGKPPGAAREYPSSQRRVTSHGPASTRSSGSVPRVRTARWIRGVRGGTRPPADRPPIRPASADQSATGRCPTRRAFPIAPLAWCPPARSPPRRYPAPGPPATFDAVHPHTDPRSSMLALVEPAGAGPAARRAAGPGARRVAHRACRGPARRSRGAGGRHGAPDGEGRGFLRPPGKDLTVRWFQSGGHFEG